jgi:anti-anti-sigma regulatory factor
MAIKVDVHFGAAYEDPVATDSRRALIQLSGRVTLTDGADLLRDTLQRLIGHGRISLVLDFRDVPYIDSQAMAIFIRTQATLGRHGGGLKRQLNVD